tara:strand:+ start:548 stop:667 length:120 start_codon:yes stop_codon:yes gene_type:complete
LETQPRRSSESRTINKEKLGDDTTGSMDGIHGDEHKNAE